MASPKPIDMPDRFFHDVRNHEMTVVSDNDVMRHVTFANPARGAYRFALTTWPGHLAITGDCDDFVFARERDMFAFFRAPAGAHPRGEAFFGDIAFDYWAEKAVAVSATGGVSTFSPKLFRAAFARDLEDHVQDLAPEAAQAARAAAQDAVDVAEINSEAEAVAAAVNYTCPVTYDRPFQDFWDHRLQEPSDGFVWACHAIRWGITRYDARMSQAA